MDLLECVCKNHSSGEPNRSDDVQNFVALKAFWKSRLAAAASRSTENKKSAVAPVESLAPGHGESPQA